MVKTALKLLLVFVEFTESNAQLLVQAVIAAEQVRGECATWLPREERERDESDPISLQIGKSSQ